MDMTIEAPRKAEARRVRVSPSASGAASLPNFHIASFDGPLELLLHLIRVNEVDIYDIPIAQIAGQYMAHIALLDELDLAGAGEFVVMAATLIEIKSRLLLPQPPPLEGEVIEDPRAELVARLLEYEKYQGVVESFKVWEELRRRLFFRGAAENAEDYLLPVGQGEANPLQLYHALHRILEQAGIDERAVTTVTPRKRLSLKLKMAEILRRVGESERIAFEALFTLPCPVYDIVIAFLALLELIRAERVQVEQEGPLGSIWIVAAGRSVA
jgi:segregation and condensation protein A